MTGTLQTYWGQRAQNRFRVAPRPTVWTFFHENVLGTSLELRVRAVSQDDAARAEQAALAAIDRLDLVFSAYNPASELRQWQGQAGVPTMLSSELREVLLRCDYWRARSKGAFDPGGEVFLRLWRNAARANCLPEQAAIDALQQQVDCPMWEINALTAEATCLSRNPFTLNAIAKGYIAGRAGESAHAQSGVDSVVVNIGGDLVVRGTQAEIVGIAHPDDADNAAPLARVRLHNNALATSGDWRRGFSVGGVLYSHVIDPRTGLPASHTRSASVFAPCAADADALATIFSVLPLGESLALADALPGVGCLLLAPDGKAHRSREWIEKEIIEKVRK